MIHRVADFERRVVLPYAPPHWLVTLWVENRKRLPNDDAYVVVFGSRYPEQSEIAAFMTEAGIRDVISVTPCHYLVAKFPDALALALRFGEEDTAHSKPA